ncbi:NADPH-dependent FMN reductase [Pseudodonghicola flavimaris]|uniref:NAD(P)H-dependent oxidoreductase n=1 Tax=Pseudodonghicola flavimaris TaxID=3050036 RepID=A0ABT7EW96_9RHOB|nr:NAD(P)H-dependent oxidoreductase [Pseudodonghicola flavimaris]MDK3016618.1 NAD(P)H-dependent oxidoreductase [Pseudodonghicola flavimaris]
MSDPTLLGLSGALRRLSTNRMLTREAARLFGPAVFVEADLALPLYDGDLEGEAGIPGAVQQLADQIAAADAVVISTPEYNKGPSGVLKNALDWVSRTAANPWADKPVAVMSSAGGRAGGERAQMVLRSFLVPFQPRLITGPELHVADCRNQFDDAGQLISDRYAATLEALMRKLRAEIGA